MLLFSIESFVNLCESVGLKVVNYEIDSMGTFQWMVLSFLYSRGYSFKNFSPNLLGLLSKSDLDGIDKRLKFIIDINIGDNVMCIVTHND